MCLCDITMKIIITGSTGLIGSRVSSWLVKCGHDVTRLVRPGALIDGIRWDIERKTIELEKLEGCDVVIHFAGANIAGNRWTPQYKEKILKSRVEGTSFLSASLAKLGQKPKLFLCASAIGYYGSIPFDRELTESSPKGKGFLADVTEAWEAAAQPAKDAGIRVVNLRFGVVLDREGGALGQMLPPFLLGLGGPIGSGQQGMSWVSLEEIPLVIEFLLKQQNVEGPINVTSPNSVTNREFVRILGKVIRRPAVLPLPSFMVKILFGEMGEELLLGGSNVKPTKLTVLGYKFAYPDLALALQAIIHSPSRLRQTGF